MAQTVLKGKEQEKQCEKIKGRKQRKCERTGIENLKKEGIRREKRNLKTTERGKEKKMQ